VQVLCTHVCKWKMIPVETIPRIRVGHKKGEWWMGWIQVWYIWYTVRTFVHATMYFHPAQELKKVSILFIDLWSWGWLEKILCTFSNALSRIPSTWMRPSSGFLWSYICNFIPPFLGTSHRAIFRAWWFDNATCSSFVEPMLTDDKLN
jgi:hypothetical protein